MRSSAPRRTRPPAATRPAGPFLLREGRGGGQGAMGRSTHELASAYLGYLETGDTAALARLGYPHPAPADQQARELPVARELVARLVQNLEQRGSDE